jgi:hypothetical protein
MQLLRKRDSRIVIGQLTASLAVLARERNTVVDVEDAVGAAGRPDSGRGLDAVLLGVDLAVCEGATAGEGGAGCLLCERQRTSSLSLSLYINYRIERRGGEGRETYGLASVLGEVVGRDE